jgi:hypothetical protein
VTPAEVSSPAPSSERVRLHRPPGSADKIGWRAANAKDPDAAGDTAMGAAVLDQLNTPYTQRPPRFRPRAQG